MKANGSLIWHCQRIPEDNAEIPTFKLPKEITTRIGYLTVQPLGDADTSLVEYGEDITKYQKILAQPYERWYGVFNENDRLYIDGKVPNEEDLDDIYAENANYLVKSVGNQNKAIRVVLKKRTAE